MADGRSMLVCCCLAVLLCVLIHRTNAAAGNNLQSRAPIGGSCTNSSNCTSPHSVCRNNRCACEDGYEVNGTICLIKLHSECNRTRVCNRTGATCSSSGKCVCKADHVEEQQNCWKLATRVGDVCSRPIQCQNVGNTTCSTGSCRCNSGYFNYGSSNRCERTSCTPGGCTNMGPYASCYLGYCQCNQEYVQSGSACYNAIGTVGAKCDPSKMDLCFLAVDGSNNVQCISNKCTCDKHFKPNKDKTRCVSGSASTALASVTSLLLVVFACLRPIFET